MWHTNWVPLRMATCLASVLSAGTSPPTWLDPREAACVACGTAGQARAPRRAQIRIGRGRAMAKARERRWDAADMALRGRIGAHVLHARYDSRVLTANARAAFPASFERAPDPDRRLPTEERRRRVTHLRSTCRSGCDASSIADWSTGRRAP